MSVGYVLVNAIGFVVGGISDPILSPLVFIFKKIRGGWRPSQSHNTNYHNTVHMHYTIDYIFSLI